MIFSNFKPLALININKTKQLKVIFLRKRSVTKNQHSILPLSDQFIYPDYSANKRFDKASLN